MLFSISQESNLRMFKAKRYDLKKIKQEARKNTWGGYSSLGTETGAVSVQGRDGDRKD